jgi:copper oxidase (laccase) domain-containing protein
VVLGIVTADCAPILLADREAGVVGAAHAGWKGAFGGVAEATVAAVALGRGPSGLSPPSACIAQSSYEVDEAFRAAFWRRMGPAVFAEGREGHWHFAGTLCGASLAAPGGAIDRWAATLTDEEGFSPSAAPPTGRSDLWAAIFADRLG